MNCRHCGALVTTTCLDLGTAPPSNAYRTHDDLRRPETHYPLKIRVCDVCWLVQTDDYTAADDLFNAEYAYFSSTSSGWVEHARRYSEEIVASLRLSPASFVVEIASNDGYLLRNFVSRGIPCLGIEPTLSTAAAAERDGVPVLREFFGHTLGRRLAAEGRQADLIVGNNVYAHVPEINDFTNGMRALLKPGGTITLEFPHVMRLLEHAQFDTVYHEHFSYLSLRTVREIFSSCGLRIYRVETLSTHGGSLRVFGCHEADVRETEQSVTQLLEAELREGVTQVEAYTRLQPRAERIKDDLVAFLIEQKRAGRTVVGYGAAAKGNTLLNFAGVRPDLLPVVYDAARAKQGKYLPGSHIPILGPDALMERRPDFVLILPWNIADEVKRQLEPLARAGTRFVTAVPRLEVA
jgi:hypothetical protein